MDDFNKIIVVIIKLADAVLERSLYEWKTDPHNDEHL